MATLTVRDHILVPDASEHSPNEEEFHATSPVFQILIRVVRFQHCQLILYLSHNTS
jgi:hypothetical protein